MKEHIQLASANIIEEALAELMAGFLVTKNLQYMYVGPKAKPSFDMFDNPALKLGYNRSHMYEEAVILIDKSGKPLI